ncbi:MAG TPA: DUF2255 family protein [Candidatus Angelobacter sp.]|nr:DUF2255 family protein [Candidatus Angelobacter sp.]
MAKRFPKAILAGFETTKYLYIRAGDHRFIPIWVVVVDGRVLVRSWNDKAGGWYRAFLDHPAGAVKIDDKEVPVRAVGVSGAHLIEVMDAAYAAKYTTKANAKYVEGLRSPKRQAVTLELVPGG